MRAIFEIVWQEYKRYIFTRGFLIFLLIMPAAAVFGASTSFIQRAAETEKLFVVLDQDGGWADRIDRQLSLRAQERALQTWDAYVQGLTITGTLDTEGLPPPFDPEDAAPERVRRFAEAGGLEGGRTLLSQRMGVDLPPIEPPKVSYRRVALPDDLANAQDADALGQSVLPYIRGEKELEGEERLFGALFIPAGFGSSAEGREAVFLTDNMADRALPNDLRAILRDGLQTQAFAEAGLAEGEVVRIKGLEAAFSVVKAGSSAEDEAQRLRDRVEFAVPLGLTYILFFVVISAGSMMLTNTIEEKSNKIVEMLLSSVSARQLMIGKLIGLALVGLTPLIIFGSLGFLLLTLFGGGDETLGLVRDVLVSSPLVPLFFLYFLLGYALYASIYLAVGALCESIQDAQQLSIPMTIIMLLPAPFLMTIVQDPNGLFARIFTWIPFYTHYALMLRLSSSPPVWEIAAATVMLTVAVAVMLFFMGRIYRAGILQSGGNATFGAMLAAARGPKELAAR
ncbi:MAG: ABC transporter permease [Parvularcula sp.]|jgi:ABC-2 type transport system permease protein|nr:ABC transporter permease [Parvularcula sp.]